ncbi:MAG: hypothetical protein KF901_20675 [Myxococcales bacterium]|nr:hypothetical protein [Myxococcales bacterium]
MERKVSARVALVVAPLLVAASAAGCTSVPANPCGELIRAGDRCVCPEGSVLVEAWVCLPASGELNVEIQPQIPRTVDDLSAVVEFVAASPSGSPYQYSYQWYRAAGEADLEAVEGMTDVVVPHDSTQKNETWVIEVSAVSADGMFALIGSSRAVVRNSPPVLRWAAMDEYRVVSGDNLRVLSAFEDDDGDDVRVDVEWRVDGGRPNELAGERSALVSTEGVTVGARVYAHVTAHDGEDTSETREVGPAAILSDAVPRWRELIPTQDLHPIVDHRNDRILLISSTTMSMTTDSSLWEVRLPTGELTALSTGAAPAGLGDGRLWPIPAYFEDMILFSVVNFGRLRIFGLDVSVRGSERWVELGGAGVGPEVFDSLGVDKSNMLPGARVIDLEAKRLYVTVQPTPGTSELWCLSLEPEGTWHHVASEVTPHGSVLIGQAAYVRRGTRTAFFFGGLGVSSGAAVGVPDVWSLDLEQPERGFAAVRHSGAGPVGILSNAVELSSGDVLVGFGAARFDLGTDARVWRLAWRSDGELDDPVVAAELGGRGEPELAGSAGIGSIGPSSDGRALWATTVAGDTGRPMVYSYHPDRGGREVVSSDRFGPRGEVASPVGNSGFGGFYWFSRSEEVVWEYRTETRRWRRLSIDEGPRPSNVPAQVSDSQGPLRLFDGRGALWLLAGARWRQHGEPHASLVGRSMFSVSSSGCHDSLGLFVGGADAVDRGDAGVVVCRAGVCDWVARDGVVSPRREATLVRVDGTQMFLFGGRSGGVPVGESRLVAGCAEVETSTPLFAGGTPAARWGHSSTVIYGVGMPDQMVVTGGVLDVAENDSADDVWKVGLLEDRSVYVWEQIVVAGDGDDGALPRINHVSWSHGQSVYVFGGRRPGNRDGIVLGDLWELRLP